MSIVIPESQEVENLAQTLARVLPQPEPVWTDDDATRAGGIHHVAIPKGYELKKLDNEFDLPNPRRTKALVTLSDAPSFIQYVTTHKNEGTVVWCNFNPQTYKLDFKAIINDHSATTPGWRDHVATYTPAFSAEWKTWTSAANKLHSQLEFAEFIEQNERDIASLESFPSSLQMLTMATNFVARQDQLLKSATRLQSGGIDLQYLVNPDAGTVETMSVFEKFALGLPVFWAGPAYQAQARLKYRLGQGKVTFFYELIRPDLIHQAAALELITTVRSGVGEVPVLMGLSN